MKAPAYRRLRVLAFDPSLTTRLDTSTLNQLTLEVPWEDGLEPGPVGEYVEVIDRDPASGVFYAPVDLDDPHLLAQDGIAPSESNPQFHQQMVYAVTMATIGHFERALGRVAFWADRRFLAGGGHREQFVRRLRIYPHALRDRNAYYSPAKKALLFGYFPTAAKDAHNTPGTVVFTALSHDIVAHEVTHALLDGVHPRFNEPTNADVHAFHEAFADIVALFQHFSYPQVLESQIRRTRGNLDAENLLSQLAQQFGHATGRRGALRDALGHVDEQTGRWRPQEPDPHALDRVTGAHARGAILVAAVFRAFLLIYRAQTADLFRIATHGTGTLPEGDIHPDLTKRLAAEAAECADRVLQMCIRAIDYCPPVDVTFGDFLRAVVTADLDFAPEDEGSYRVVFVQSFREWGIRPRGATSMGIEALAWPSGEELARDLGLPAGGLEDDTAFVERVLVEASAWNLESRRYQTWKVLHPLRRAVHDWLLDGNSSGRHYAELFGLVVDEEKAPPTVTRSSKGAPAFEVHSVRPALRRTARGQTRTDLVIEITQSRDGYFDPAKQAKADGRPRRGRRRDRDFAYRAGCTVLLDLARREVRRVIRTAGRIDDDEQLERVRRFLCGEQGGVVGNAFDAGLPESRTAGGPAMRKEPFALLHLGAEDGR